MRNTYTFTRHNFKLDKKSVYCINYNGNEQMNKQMKNSNHR